MIRVAGFAWLHLTLLLPLVGAVVCALTRSPVLAARISSVVLAASLATSAAAGWFLSGAGPVVLSTFAVDAVSAPILPAVVLLHWLTLLGTSKARMSSSDAARVLLSALLSVAALTCPPGWPLIALLVAGVTLPLHDLRQRGAALRGYGLYMVSFAGLLTVGWHVANDRQQPWGWGVLLLALVLRGGIVPLHGWLPALFQRASYSTAMVLVLPMTEMLAALRLLSPAVPSWMLDAAAGACLVTAVYGGGLAMVQTDVRRFYAHVCMSQTSLALIGLMLHTTNSLTAALALWISSSLSLSGLAFSVRAIEARFGALSLTQYHGHYEQVPGLAVSFLVTGLASIGFPGTIGFVPLELLVSGTVERGLWMSFTLAVATMFNGIAIMRAYFSLFTGKRPTTSVSLRVTPVEHTGIVLIVMLVLVGGGFSPQLIATAHRTAAGLLEPSAAGSHR